MQGLMQDVPLTQQHVLWRMEKLFGRKEIVTWQPGGRHRYTFADFCKRVRGLAGALQRLGVKQGDRVATLAWNNWRHLELYYAVPCMGAVLHTLNLRLFPEHLEFIINDAQDVVLAIDVTLLPLLQKVADKIPCVRHVVVMDEPGLPSPSPFLDYETLLAADSDSFDWPALDERQAAVMCYTSGTTGNPKGVVYSHRSNFLHTLVLMQGELGLREHDVCLPIVPMFHANSWGLPYACGMAGSKVIFPHRQMGDAETIVALAEEEGATQLSGVPTIWMSTSDLLERTGKRLPKVTRVLCGGSAVPRSLMERMDAVGLKIIHAWGMTETSPLGSMALPMSWHTAEEQLPARLTQGTPAPCVEIRITEDGQDLPWDGKAFGELEVRGPWVASGYHNQADSDRMTADGWFRTGDVASITEEGYIVIVDRTKDVIKSGGEWISSVELENAIMAHPDVQEAAVVAVAHPKWMERPVAYVVVRPDRTLTASDVLEFVRPRVASWWLPDDVRFIDAIPRTSVGKFDKKVLRAQAQPLQVG